MFIKLAGNSLIWRFLKKWIILSIFTWECLTSYKHTKWAALAPALDFLELFRTSSVSYKLMITGPIIYVETLHSCKKYFYRFAFYLFFPITFHETFSFESVRAPESFPPTFLFFVRPSLCRGTTWSMGRVQGNYGLYFIRIFLCYMFYYFNFFAFFCIRFLYKFVPRWFHTRREPNK